MEDQVLVCSNCFILFPADRIDLHEAYCCRNIRKCKQCDRMIDIKDQELHDNQFHNQKQCPLCKQMIQPDAALQHEQLCPQKPKVCKYCENTWPQIDYSRHVEACGARTKPCLICYKNVMLRDFDQHSVRCQRRREERAEVSQDQIRQRGLRRNERGNGERERQSSTNNMREPLKSNSLHKIIKPQTFKPTNIIGPELIRAVVDPVPISVRLALKSRGQPRIPLKSKN